jgi:hypothetical protein
MCMSVMINFANIIKLGMHSVNISDLGPYLTAEYVLVSEVSGLTHWRKKETISSNKYLTRSSEQSSEPSFQVHIFVLYIVSNIV